MLFGRFDQRRWLKVGEAMLVAAVSALVFMILIFAVPDCKPVRGVSGASQAPGAHHRVNTTGRPPPPTPPGNSTIDDVIAAADDVTRDPGTGITNVSEHGQHDEDHGGGHGGVFQVGNTTLSTGLDLHNKKHLKNVGPIRHCETPHAHSPGVASGTVARRLRIDVHDNENDNA